MMYLRDREAQQMLIVIATGRLICTHTKALISICKECLFFEFFSLGRGGVHFKGFPVLVIMARSTELSMKVKTVI